MRFWAVLFVAACGGGTPPPSVPTPPPATTTTQSAVEVKTTPAPATFGLAGSRLRLKLPDGFVRPSRHPTIVQPQLGIIVSLLEMTLSPTDGDDAIDGLVKVTEDLQSAKRTEITRGSAKGFIISGGTQKGNLSLLALRDGTAIGAMMVQHPASSSAAKSILDSVWLDTKMPLDPMLEHGISIGKADWLEVWTAMTPPVMFKAPGVTPPIPPESANLGIMALPIERPGDLDGVVSGIMQEEHVDPKTAKQTPLDVDGVKAVEIIADGKHGKLATKFYALAMLEPGSGLVAWSHVAKPAELDRVRKLARSIHRLDGVIGPVKTE